MTPVIHYRIDPSFSAETYRPALRAIAPCASTFGLILHMKPDVLHESAKQVLDRLQSHLIRVESVQAWPGTQLAGSRTVERHLFHLDPDSLTVLVSSAVGPFDWVNPMLPEDLHFLREDDSVLLGTIAQEEESWLELTSAEYQDISLGLPSGVRLQAQV